MSVPTIDEDDVTFEDIATLCEESQDELADLFMQEVPFFSFIKSEPKDDVNTTTDEQVMHFLHCTTDVSDITHISHEETCCSNDCYNEARSPESDGSHSHLSPDNRKKCNSTRKNRTPNTLRHIMEKHRHSERIRHHTLNEQLKAICQLIPGSADDSRETKVVMMQRVISYIAFLENTIKMLCCSLGSQPHPNWVLLTEHCRDYFRDYFKGVEDSDIDDDEVLMATQNLSRSMKAEDGEYGRQKVSSPTVDSTTDCVVPVMVPPMGSEVTVLSQDSTVPSSSLPEDEDLWTASGQVMSVGQSHGDGDVFFSSSVDEGVSAVLEISSSTQVDSDTIILDFEEAEDVMEERREIEVGEMTVNAQPFIPTLRPQSYVTSATQSSYHGYHTLMRPQQKSGVPVRRNKRKQLSPRRSSCSDDYLSERAYLPSWSSQHLTAVTVHPDDTRSVCQGRALPYNIRCNHRHAVQRLQASRHKGPIDCPVQHVYRPQKSPARVAETEDKLSGKLDLRKTSWMNGFMMFSRLNRRKFIQQHPGVHTSHISKIMGHAWRNMGKEEQAPYKEKAKLCAQELYRAYTTQPDFPLSVPGAADTLDMTATTDTPDMTDTSDITATSAAADMATFNVSCNAAPQSSLIKTEVH